MNYLAKAYDGLIFGLACLAGLALVLIFYLVMQDAILRNLLISPPPWSPPVTEYAMLYVTMFTAPWLLRTRGHILLEVIRRKLTPDAAKILEIIVYVFCTCVCLVLAWHAISLFIEAWRTGEEDHRGIDIPRTFLFGPAAIAMPLLACEFLRFLFGRDSLYQGGVMGGEGV